MNMQYASNMQLILIYALRTIPGLSLSYLLISMMAMISVLQYKVTLILLLLPSAAPQMLHTAYAVRYSNPWPIHAVLPGPSQWAFTYESFDKVVWMHLFSGKYSGFGMNGIWESWVQLASI